MDSVELFSGCGGLALGLSRAGFKHLQMVEWDADAVKTVEHNRSRRIAHVANWPILRADVRDVEWSKFSGKIDLIAGGPPCQPFAIGGKKAGHDDSRDMWPETIRAVREIQPRAFAFENVRNLAGPRFREYLNWILAHLEHPDCMKRPSELHTSHLARLRKLKSSPKYTVGWHLVNAADFGAPQVRWRVIVFGVRADLSTSALSLSATHSKEKLLWDKWVSGEYWERHRMRRPDLTDERVLAKIATLAKNPMPAEAAWVTVRDALCGLGEPNGKRNHVLQPGARSYPGHTGSELDMPSKALKAGDHGVPGGENMMIIPGVGVRYYTTREAARLVGIPDTFLFPRSWTESMRQLGNAVPVQLAEAAGDWLKKMIASKVT